MALSDLELLDVSDNAIEVGKVEGGAVGSHAYQQAVEAQLLWCCLQIVPKGLFPNIDKLKHLDLSHNSIKSLPDDLSALK